MLAWEEARVLEGSYAPIAVKELSLKLAKQLLEKGDVERLLRLAKLATDTKALQQSKLDEEYAKQMERSQYSAQTWNKRFLWCYVAGSLLLGIR